MHILKCKRKKNNKSELLIKRERALSRCQRKWKSYERTHFIQRTRTVIRSWFQSRENYVTIEKLKKIGVFIDSQGKTTAQKHIVRVQQIEAADNIELPPNRSINQFPVSSGALSSLSSFRKGECLMSSLLHKSLWHHFTHVFPWHPAGLCQSRPQPMFFILPWYSKKQAFS